MTPYSLAYDRFLDILKKKYSYYDYKKIADLHLEKYKPDFENITNTQDYITKVLEISELFKDKHFEIFYKAKSFSNLKEPTKFRGDITFNLFEKIGHTPVGFVGKLGDTFYLRISSWGKDSAGDFFPLYKVLIENIDNNCKNIIFDVRGNRGGASNIAKQFVRLIVDKNKEFRYCKMFERTSEEDPTLFIEKNSDPIKGNKGFSGNVYCIINQDCISSNELFILMMKQAGAVLVGNTTCGATANPALIFDEQIYVSYKIASWVIKDMNDNTIENNGISPDIEILQKDMYQNDKDMAIEKVFELIKK